MQNNPQLQAVLLASDYAAQIMQQYPTLLSELEQSKAFSQNCSAQDYQNQLQTQLAKIDNEENLMQALRLFRHRHLLRILWRDVNKLADLKETLLDLSNLADACLTQSLDCLFTWAKPKEDTTVPIIIALGKLGGRELNFSSDVDLIVCYVDGDESFYTKLIQDWVRVLSKRTTDGFVYRMDLRLRPFGQAGPIAIRLSALENYYQSHGRAWERYALVKARALNGKAQPLKSLLRVIRSFVYRHYVDYTAIEALRDMKQLIEQEIISQNLMDDIKRGPGGIRQVEFIGQVFQLIRGGQDKYLQQRQILSVLAHLGDHKTLPKKVTQQLSTAYCFLRDVENRLQMLADQQTHVLPQNNDSQQRLAQSLSFKSWDAFYKELQSHRDQVAQHFAKTIEPPTKSTEKNEAKQQIWHQNLQEEFALTALEKIGFTDAHQAQQDLNQFFQSRRYRALTQEAHDRIERILPLLFVEIGSTEQSEQTLKRVLIVLDAVMRRSIYLVILWEKPQALKQFVRACATSAWITEQFRAYPLLLDELLHAPISDRVFTQQYQQILMDQLNCAPESDLEQQMTILRRFHHSQVLQIALADAMQTLPLMKVSDCLTFLAEAILQQVQILAYQDIKLKYGEFYAEDKTQLIPDLGILAYGKLGGIELGYASDLDLVFLHPGLNLEIKSDGEKNIDLQEFYLRWAQRIVTLLQARTVTGILYRIDTRLRPGGSAGLLVISQQTFAEYQQQQAWTWEHQALVRTRMITGSDTLKQSFMTIRSQRLKQVRVHETLKKDVRDMRQRMRTELLRVKPGKFDVKQGPGGITDIEFLAQFAVLAWANQHLSLLTYPDTIRILETCTAEGLLTPQQAQQLIDAYQAYRQVVHHTTLQNLPAIVADTELRVECTQVQAIWQAWLD